MNTIGAGHRWFYVAPALAFIAAFFLLPLGALFFTSIHGWDLSLREYEAFFVSAAYVNIGLRTLGIGATVTFICLLIGYPAAYAIAAAPTRWRSYLMICVILPYLTSILVRTYAWLVILGDRGFLNDALLFLGVIDRPIEILYTRTGMILAMVHVMLPFMVLPIYSVMQGIDRSLIRASHALGGGAIRTFLIVYAPLTVPGVRSGSILVFVICLGFYVTPAALGGLGDTMLSVLIETQVNGALNFPFGAAVGFLLLAVTILFYVLLGGGGTGAVGFSSASGSRSVKVSPLASVMKHLICILGFEAVATRISGLLFQRNIWKARGRSVVAPVMLGVTGMAVLLFLIMPSLIVVTISFSGDDFLRFPPTSWSMRWYESLFQSSSWLEPTWLSIQIAFSSTVLALLLGIPAAYAFARSGGKGTSILQALFLAPIIVPVVVVGVATYGWFAGWGLLGSRSGLILAHTCGGITYVTTVLTATLMGVDSRLEAASLSMGASRLRTFLRVVLPLALPGIAASALFAFVHSLDEVVVSSFIAGIRLKTLPLRMWEDIRHQVDPTIAAVSAILVLLPILFLPLLRKTGHGR